MTDKPVGYSLSAVINPLKADPISSHDMVAFKVVITVYFISQSSAEFFTYMSGNVISVIDV